MPESAVNLSNNAQDDDAVLAQYDNSQPTQPVLKEGQLEYNWMDTLSKKFQMGSEQVANSRNNAWIMGTGGGLTDDQELKMLQAGAQKVQTGFNPADYEAQPWALRAVGDALETLPGIADTVGQGAIGGAVVGVSTALASRVVPHPFVQGVAGAIGFGQGYTAGSVKSIWEQSAGELYGELRLAGVKRDTARLLGFTFGSLSASMEFLGTHVLQKIAGGAFSLARKTAIQKTLDTPYVKTIESSMLGRLGMHVAGEVATETSTEGAQQSGTELAKVAAAVLEKMPADSFTNWIDASSNIKEAMIQALGASLVLGAGASAGGHVLGKATGALQGGAKKAQAKINAEVLNELKESTPAELLRKMQEGLNDLPNAWENPDEQSSVAYDAQGNPYIKTSVVKEQQSAATRPINETVVQTQSTNRTTGQQTLDQISKNAQVLIDQGLQSIYPVDQEVQVGEGFTPTLESEPDAQLRLPLVDWRPLNATETQARINQIQSDRNTLAKEAKRLEAQITLQEKTGSGGFKLIDKWQNVQQAMDSLDSEREVLESGLGTTDVEGPKYGKLRIKKLAGLFDKLSAQAQKLQEQKESGKLGKQQSLQTGIEKGQRSERRTIRRMQQDLLNIVNTVTEDKNIKAQVKQYVNKVTTPEQMTKAVQQIQTKVLELETKKSENAQIKERQKVFDKVVKLIQGQRVRIDNGHPSAPLPTEITNKLQTLRGYLKDEKTLKLAEFEFNVAHGATPIDQLSPEAREQMQLQNLARNLFSGDALSYNVAAANIAQWVLDGKGIMAKKQQELEDEKTDTINTAKNSMKIPQKKEKSWVQNTGQRRNEFWNDIQAGTWTWNTLLDRLSAKDREHKLTELLDDTTAHRTYLAQKDVTASAFMQAIQQRVKDPNLLQKFVDYQNTEKAITFTTKEGAAFTESLNKMQMIDALLKFQDSSVHEALREGNKWTLPGDVDPGASFIERVQGEMTAQDNELIQGILDFYKDYHTSINEVYRNEYGVDLPMRENYSPLTRQGYKVDAPFSADGLQFYSLLPGSAKTREDSKLPILLQNPIDTALHHIGQWEYWKAYTSKLRQINAVFQDTEISQHIRDEFGSGTLKVMENYIERFMKNDPLPNDPSSSFWSAVRTDLSRHALGFNYVASFATQMSSGTAMWAAHRPDQIMNGILQTILHPVQTEKALRDSPILRDRFKEGANVDLQRALRTQGLFAETIHHVLGIKPDPTSHDAANLYNRMMFAGIQYGDAGVARIFGGPVYQAELAAGKSHTEALTTVERLMEQTQQGSSVSQTPVLFTNPIVRTTMGLFTQQPVQLYGKSMSAINDFMNSPKKPTDFATLGHRLGAYWVIPGLLLGLAKATPSWLLPPDDDEDRKRTQIYDVIGSVLLDTLTGVPLFGDVVQALWFAAAKPLIGVDESARSDYFGKNPVIETLYNNPQKALQAWSSYKKEEEKLIPDLTEDKLVVKENKAQLATGRAVSGLLGIPARFTNIPLGVTERLGDGDAVGGAIAFGGWSPGTLMQRKSKNEMDSLNDLFKIDENETPYDMIEVFLNSLLRGQKLEDPAEQDKKSKVEVDEFIRSLNPNANGQP